MTGDRQSPIYLAAQRLHQAGHRALPVRPNKQPHLVAGAWRDLFKRPWRDSNVEWFFKRADVVCVALLTGFAFDVFDIEAEALDFLDGRELPETPMVRTQRGGLHIYVAAGTLGNRVVRDGARKLGEFRSRGWYVVAPPSRGAHGTYEWLEGRSLFDLPVAQPPEWMVAIAARGGQVQVDPLPAREESQRGCGRGAAMPVPAGSGPPHHRTTAVTPPVVDRPSGYASRSEEDAALARKLHLAGNSREEIVAEIAGGAAAIDRGAYGARYAELTADRVITWADDELARARANARPATIVRIDDVPRGLEFVFRTVTENGRVNDITRTINWPPDERSENVWAHLAAACGFSPDVDPEGLVGSELLVEVKTVGGRYRITRTFAADGLEQLHAWDEDTHGEPWESLHDREEPDDGGGEW